MDKKKEKPNVKDITKSLKNKVKRCSKKLKRDLMKIEENFHAIKR